MSTHTHRSRVRSVVTAAFAFGLAVSAAAPVAYAKPDKSVNANSCANRDNNSYQKLLDCVTLDGVRSHQAALQAIADENGGTRASGTPGYDASVDYVAGQLEAAGYVVTRQEFEFDFFADYSTLSRVSPDPVEYEDFTERDAMTFSGETDEPVTAPLEAVDLSIDDPAASSSGCEPEDFDGFTAGNVALIQRGACSFAQKALNAEAAGAVGVVVFNQGTPDRNGMFYGTLGGPGVTIPVFSLEYTLGLELVDLLAEGEVVLELFVDTEEGVRTTENVIAESPTGNPNNVVMAGAHLDSVARGPGLQDNGSGSAAILEVALKLAGHEPVNQLRFAWWGAEELGLIGSEYYVQNLTDEERDDIALYLNFDMIGSPNHVFFVYDANESSFDAPVAVPEGSVDIENTFERFYSWQDTPYDDSAFSGRSDYQEFINFGIPSGGLFTGAEVLKTEEQESIWGGTAGEQYDPCYHQACDTYDNINLDALDTNSDAVAFAVLTYAYSTEAVNGVPGEPVPGKPIDFGEVDGPQLTNDSNGGGGLDHDHDHDHDHGEAS